MQWHCVLNANRRKRSIYYMFNWRSGNSGYGRAVADVRPSAISLVMLVCNFIRKRFGVKFSLTFTKISGFFSIFVLENCIIGMWMCVCGYSRNMID